MGSRPVGPRDGTAGDALSDGDFAHAVFDAAASAELSVKAASLAVGEGPPTDHEVGDCLRARRRRLPAAYREEGGRWASANTRLARRGKESRHGDPPSGKTAEAILSDPREAADLVGLARTVFRSVSERTGSPRSSTDLRRSAKEPSHEARLRGKGAPETLENGRRPLRSDDGPPQPPIHSVSERSSK
jgi:HEPN domain-containing protein